MKRFHGVLLFLQIVSNNLKYSNAFQFHSVPYLDINSAKPVEQRYENNNLCFRQPRLTNKLRTKQLSTTSNSEDKSIEKWDHSDLEWRLRPSPEISRWRRLLVRAAAKAIRLECRLLRNPVPPILCPKEGKAVLEAYKGRKKIARFGITTVRGPPNPILTQSVEELYNITAPFNGPGVAAIIYMYVSPDYRKFGIGDLALEVIGAIHTVQNCDFTVLVADDNGSGRLVDWYERCGFVQAPSLQDLFGSPGGQFGLTMIRPAQMAPDIFERCTVKWW